MRELTPPLLHRNRPLFQQMSGGIPEAPLTTAGQEWAALEPKDLIKTLEPHLPSSLSVLIPKREGMTQCVVWGAARASMVMK